MKRAQEPFSGQKRVYLGEGWGYNRPFRCTPRVPICLSFNHRPLTYSEVGLSLQRSQLFWLYVQLFQASPQHTVHKFTVASHPTYDSVQYTRSWTALRGWDPPPYGRAIQLYSLIRGFNSQQGPPHFSMVLTPQNLQSWVGCDIHGLSNQPQNSNPIHLQAGRALSWKTLCRIFLNIYDILWRFYSRPLCMLLFTK